MYVLSSATGYLRVGGLIKQRRNPLLTQITNVYIHIYLCIYVSLYCCAYIDPPNLERLTYIHNHNRRVCVGGEDAADATHDQDTKPRRRGSSRVVQGLTAVWAGKEGEYEGGGSTAHVAMWRSLRLHPEARGQEGRGRKLCFFFLGGKDYPPPLLFVSFQESAVGSSPVPTQRLF